MTLRAEFDAQGFVAIDQLLDAGEVERCRQLYERFLDGSIISGHRRSDLGANAETKRPGVENITQIMWPSDLVSVLHDTGVYKKALALARELLGDDMDFDFDMLINKAAGTATITPWHQDCAYWPKLPDQRAASCWIALDEVFAENGCMWFVPGSHLKPHRPHRAGPRGGALECDGSESEALCVPLKAGGCTFHGGATLHYSRGNATQGPRRALILNFRPRAMIAMERAMGYDHGQTNNVRSIRNELNG